MSGVRVFVILLIAAGGALFAGMMVAVAGGALYTPLYRAAAPLACDGEFVIESHSYSYKPGQSGVRHNVFCRDRATGAREEITLYAIFVASLVYSALAFPFALLLTYLVARAVPPKGARRPARGLTVQSIDIPAAAAQTTIVFNGRTYSSAEEMPAEAREAYERVMGVFADSDRDGVPDLFESAGLTGFAEQQQAKGEPAERLAKLRGLRDAGLITEEEYQAKRAEVLSQL